MLKKIFVLGKVMALVLAMSVIAVAEDVGDIVSKAYKAAYYGGDDGKATVKMSIVDKQGRERKRKITLLRKDIEDNGRQKYFAYFKEPADVKKMVFMVYKDQENGDSRWLYMPALDLVRRIAASDKSSSFVGSDFTYEDISGRDLNSDIHELIGEDDKFFILKNVPKENEKFKYYKTWISKDTYMPVKSEYYDQNDKLYRIMSASKIGKVDGIDTILEMKAEDLESGGYTINTFEDVEYNLGIDESIFTERYLRRAPLKYLK